MRKTVLVKSLIVAVAALLLFALAFNLATPPRVPSPRVSMTREEVLTEILAVGTDHELQHGFDDQRRTLLYVVPTGGLSTTRMVRVYFSEDGKVAEWKVEQQAMDWRRELWVLFTGR